MRTDLAHEKSPKPHGNYVTLFCEERDLAGDTDALTLALAELLPDLDGKRVLVAGLGNEGITPDSLGVRAAGKVLATAHFASGNASTQSEFVELGLREVYVLQPGVMAQTGMESAEQLRLISSGLKPDYLIVIDSLACSSVERLAATIQLTDTGISPGSGVKNNRCEISSKVMGVPVIAIGVPTVIDWHSAGAEPTSSEVPFMVVPRDIDVIINHYAKVIGGAVNRVLNPALDESEIEGLLV